MTTIRVSQSRGAASAEVVGFYEPDTGSVQYLAIDPATRKAAIIDAVWNFDPRSARTSTHSADEILEYAGKHGIEVQWILDTHPHADHFMAGAYLKEQLGVPQAIGAKVREVADIWAKLYNLPDGFDPEASFDRLLDDGERFEIGTLPVRVMLSPGHTVASISYIVGTDAAFVHDTLMYPDSGTARADFPGADPVALYRSIQEILALPRETRLFVGHDYCKEGREPRWEASVEQQRAHNVDVKDGVTESAFVVLRKAKDERLPLPDRMLHALQVNLRGGRLPGVEADGHSYLKVPVDRFS